MNQVIVTNDRVEIENAIVRATDDANAGPGAGARARTVTWVDARAWAQDVCRYELGRYETDGGGVANSYGYKAATSALAIVWATDLQGRKHVRVCGARIGCSGRHVGSLLGNRATARKLADNDCEMVLVYDQLFRLYAGQVPGTEGFSRRLKKSPADATSWLVLADWCEEHDRAEDAALIRQFFAFAPATV